MKIFQGLQGGSLKKRESNEQKESEKTEGFPPTVFFGSGSYMTEINGNLSSHAIGVKNLTQEFFAGKDFNVVESGPLTGRFVQKWIKKRPARYQMSVARDYVH